MDGLKIGDIVTAVGRIDDWWDEKTGSEMEITHVGYDYVRGKITKGERMYIGCQTPSVSMKYICIPDSPTNIVHLK